jgi:DUF1009 family protein
MKKSVTSNKNILLIAGSGNFAYESAIHLYKINKLKKIFLISDNKSILKRFDKIVKVFDIRNLELIFKSIKKEKILNVIIIGYATLPKMNEIKLSLLSKLYLTKNFYMKNINNQSTILKKLISSRNINLLSQKLVFKDLLIKRSDQSINDSHRYLVSDLKSNKKKIKKIFSLNMAQSFIMNGDRILAYEDIYGTDNLINRIGRRHNEFKNLIFVKSKKNNQLDEIDFPVIGLQTLKLLKKYNFKAICLFNGNTIVSNKDKFKQYISESNLSLIVL